MRNITDSSPIVHRQTPKIQKIAVSPLIFSIHWKRIDWLWGRPPCLERKKCLTMLSRAQAIPFKIWARDCCGIAFWVTNESCQDLIRDYFFLTVYTCSIKTKKNSKTCWERADSDRRATTNFGSLHFQERGIHFPLHRSFYKTECKMTVYDTIKGILPDWPEWWVAVCCGIRWDDEVSFVIHD